MRSRRPLAVLAMLCPLLAPSAGCLSLSLFNREVPDTKARLDSLDNRVKALEDAIGSHPPPTVIAPGPSMETMPPPAGR